MSFELLAHDLFGKRKAFGEIVMDATHGKTDWEPIYFRISQNLVAGSKLLTDTKAGFVFDQFIHNLGGAA